jgi:hypothetical protein
VEQPEPEPDNPLMRKKKTPEELAREAEEEDLDDFTSEYCPMLTPYLMWFFCLLFPDCKNYFNLSLSFSKTLCVNLSISFCVPSL